MNRSVTQNSADRRIALWPWLLAALIWTALLGAFAVVEVREEREQVLRFALVEARASLDKDLLYRRWASGHGGVYVPPSEKSPPNPYLTFVPDRDVVTTTGKKLTLVNPAYMTRQVHELAGEQYGTKGHITSTKPIRPENFPDDWEERTLLLFEAGAREKWEVSDIGGEPYLRYMRVLYAEARCLTCHAAQGYREGEVRGGLSTSVPLSEFSSGADEEIRRTLLVNVSIWLVGIVAIFFMRRTVLAGTAELSRSLAETERSKARYGSLFDNMVDGFAAMEFLRDEAGVAVDFRYIEVNREFERIYGLGASSLRRKSARELGPGGPPSLLSVFLPLARSGLPVRHEEFLEESGRHVEIIAYSTGNDEFAAIVRDVTQKKAADAEREMLTSQLAQSQKMEAIGKLAGGVAHDFNNMLGVMLGNAEMALLDLPGDDPRRESITEIISAGRRSSEITRQLLAFARKQTISPKVLSVNAHIEAMIKMLRRLIGEDINLLWEPGGDVWRIKIDPSQLDQVLANLATNARDAITGVGTVAIETGNAVITAEYARTHPGFLPGSYALLTFSDDGCGIERDKLSSIFEPFYTTKAKGKGTGLGLATIYGIVKQNGGFINAYSEPGHGATFKLYFPAVEAELDLVEGEADVSSIRGAETILVVEDEPAILKLTVQFLTTLGYRVLAASDGREALALAKAHTGEIALVVTDVVMPEMNGRELCARISEIVPGVKCIYMSGYTANIIAHRGVLDEGVNFLSKPFSMVEIGRRVRTTLDA